MYYIKIFKHIVALSCLVLAAFMLNSCVAENDSIIGAGTLGSKPQIALQLPTTKSISNTVSAQDSETRIGNLSLFVFKSSNGEKEFSTRVELPVNTVPEDIDMSRWAEEQVITLLNTQVLSNLAEKRNIHIVANIDAGKLDAITTENELKEFIVINDGRLSSQDADKEFLMHGSSTNHDFSTNLTSSISLIRNVAKVKLNINTTDFMLGKTNIKLLPSNQKISCRVLNVAKSAYLIDSQKTYQTGYLHYQANAFEADSRTINSTKALHETYIFENLQTKYDVDKNVTYIILQIPYQVEGVDKIETNNYYKILLNKENGYAINRNTIYDLTLNISSLGSEVDASAPLLSGKLNVLPWNEKTITSDISQTYLTVKETVTKMRLISDFFYATNAEIDNCALESKDSWLTASFDRTNPNIIKLNASTTGYVSSRITTFKLIVNNLTKVITVKQQVEPVSEGSVAIAPRALYLSEVSPMLKAKLSLTPTIASWMQLEGDATIATCNLENGTGESSLEFKRGQTIGNTYYKFANLNTLEYDSIKVCNISLSVSSEEVGVPGEGGSFVESDIKALGGDAKWVVKSKPDWVTSAENIDGNLSYKVAAEPNELDRDGIITIAHINDENYTKEIHLKQSAKYVRFPDYDYLVVRFLFIKGRDLDTATEVNNTSIIGLDKKPVGWSMGSSQGIARKYKNLDFIEWAGDNQRDGYEAVFVNMYNLCNPAYSIYEELPRYFNVDLYACWYSSRVEKKTIDMEIILYKGGKMSRVNTFDYENKGGTKVHEQIYKDIMIPSHTDRNDNTFLPNFRRNYTPIGTIRYDKFKNTATMTLGATSNTDRSLQPLARDGSPVAPKTKAE